MQHVHPYPVQIVGYSHGEPFVTPYLNRVIGEDLDAVFAVREEVDIETLVPVRGCNPGARVVKRIHLLSVIGRSGGAKPVRVQGIGDNSVTTLSADQSWTPSRRVEAVDFWRQPSVNMELNGEGEKLAERDRRGNIFLLLLN